MSPLPRHIAPVVSPADRDACLGRALALLLQGYDYAKDLGCQVWDFAIEIDSLRAAGLTNSDLRWLAARGYVEHAAEVTPAGDAERCFQPECRLVLSARTAVVLTADGAAYCRAAIPGPRLHHFHSGGNAVVRLVPNWDGSCRELRVGGRLVKGFKQPAPSQEVVLAAFEEEGWPPHIDDPLPPQPGQEPKRRLHETITNLNRFQKQRLIQFQGDGTGCGVRWRLLCEGHVGASPALV